MERKERADRKNPLFLFFLPTAIVEGLVDFFEMLIGDVGIDLRRGDRSMTKHGLDATDIGAIDEEVGSKAVAQGMWVDFFHDTGLGGIVFDETLYASGREAKSISFRI